MKDTAEYGFSMHHLDATDPMKPEQASGVFVGAVIFLVRSLAPSGRESPSARLIQERMNTTDEQSAFVARVVAKTRPQG
ncbi:MAG: hypothetical protein GVY35_08060 [Bacteroidetes bacterium]|jgi:hypothetical protein|nr:hypothetical protein [Bacteroidota bacterium]